MRISVGSAIGCIISAFVSVGSSAAASGQAPVQQASSSDRPFIAASAVGESRVTPDRAMVQVSVETSNESASRAGADNREKQERVIQAVKAAGIAAPQIRTIGYRVFPEYAQPERGKAPRVTGYRASNSVQIEVRNIDIVGKVIDAALGAGATNIGQVGLYPSSMEASRKEAVQNAVTKARGEAETAAAAAGGSLGPMIELVIEPGSLPRPVMQQVVATSAVYSSAGEMSPAAYGTPVEPGEAVVTAMVRVRWQFVGGTR